MSSVLAPAQSDPRHAPLRLLTQFLTDGRSSVLHRALVDEGQLCSWVAADLASSLEPGAWSVAAEVLPGVEPERVEAELFRVLTTVLDAGSAPRRSSAAAAHLEADWIFGHERIHQQALTLASALAHHDADFPERYLASVLAASRDRVLEVGREVLRLDSGVLGWSLPESPAA